MRLYFPDAAELPLPPGHSFPAVKYRLLREAVAAAGLATGERLLPSPEATLEEIRRAHSDAYVQAVLDGTLEREAQRRIGLPWSPSLAQRALATVGGTLAAARAALGDGISGQLAGGTHHAHREFGSGYCVFNDCAVTALTLLAEGRIVRAAVLDLDVHHGDGNATLLAPRGDVFVASVHGATNFPFAKPPSDLDIGLADGADDTLYLAACGNALDAVLGFRPDLVLYISGVDPLAEDRLGRLSVTIEGLARRDELVFRRCRAAAAPVAVAIGGGYADPIALTVEAYAQTFRIARAVYGAAAVRSPVGSWRRARSRAARPME